jgi:hypothetical protein
MPSRRLILIAGDTTALDRVKRSHEQGADNQDSSSLCVSLVGNIIELVVIE